MYAQKGLDMFKTHLPETYVLLQIQGYSFFYQRKWEELLQIQWLTPQVASLFVESVLLLQVAVHILQGQHKQATQRLLRMTEAMDNKVQWNVNVRIMEIILFVEMDKLDLASNKIESLRKHIAKYEVEGRERDSYRLLKALEYQNFSFQPKPEIDQIMRDIEREAWASFSYEPIHVPSWFRAKQQRVDYWTIFLQYIANQHAAAVSPET